MHEIADFRSDTVTRPTAEMYEAMQRAPVGDDVLGDDPTIQELEALGAELLGFEASLFCPSGTQANQIAFRVHGRAGDEVMLEASAHTFANEGGALSGINGLHPRILKGEMGMLDLDEVKANVRGADDHHARTRIIALENTHNAAGGAVLPQDQVIAMGEFARSQGLAFHLDGARIANAAVASGKSMAELCQPFDSATICLSKGLCAPVGSLVCGSKDFIHEARRIRKMFGGGMRQVGILGACGILSMTKMVERLAEDHANNKVLAQGLSEIEGIEVNLASAQTNMVYFQVSGREADYPAFDEALRKNKVWALHFGPWWRMVCHHDVDSEDVTRALEAWREIMA